MELTSYAVIIVQITLDRPYTNLSKNVGVCSYVDVGQSTSNIK